MKPSSSNNKAKPAKEKRKGGFPSLLSRAKGNPFASRRLPIKQGQQGKLEQQPPVPRQKLPPPPVAKIKFTVTDDDEGNDSSKMSSLSDHDALFRLMRDGVPKPTPTPAETVAVVTTQTAPTKVQMEPATEVVAVAPVADAPVTTTTTTTAAAAAKIDVNVNDEQGDSSLLGHQPSLPPSDDTTGSSEFSYGKAYTGDHNHNHHQQVHQQIRPTTPGKPNVSKVPVAHAVAVNSVPVFESHLIFDKQALRPQIQPQQQAQQQEHGFVPPKFQKVMPLTKAEAQKKIMDLDKGIKFEAPSPITLDPVAVQGPRQQHVVPSPKQQQQATLQQQPAAPDQERSKSPLCTIFKETPQKMPGSLLEMSKPLTPVSFSILKEKARTPESFRERSDRSKISTPMSFLKETPQNPNPVNADETASLESRKEQEQQEQQQPQQRGAVSTPVPNADATTTIDTEFVSALAVKDLPLSTFSNDSTTSSVPQSPLENDLARKIALAKVKALLNRLNPTAGTAIPNTASSEPPVEASDMLPLTRETMLENLETPRVSNTQRLAATNSNSSTTSLGQAVGRASPSTALEPRVVIKAATATEEPPILTNNSTLNRMRFVMTASSSASEQHLVAPHSATLVQNYSIAAASPADKSSATIARIDETNVLADNSTTSEPRIVEGMSALEQHSVAGNRTGTDDGQAVARASTWADGRFVATANTWGERSVPIARIDETNVLTSNSTTSEPHIVEGMSALEQHSVAGNLTSDRNVVARASTWSDGRVVGTARTWGERSVPATRIDETSNLASNITTSEPHIVGGTSTLEQHYVATGHVIPGASTWSDGRFVATANTWEERSVPIARIDETNVLASNSTTSESHIVEGMSTLEQHYVSRNRTETDDGHVVARASTWADGRVVGKARTWGELSVPATRINDTNNLASNSTPSEPHIVGATSTLGQHSVATGQVVPGASTWSDGRFVATANTRGERSVPIARIDETNVLASNSTTLDPHVVHSVSTWEQLSLATTRTQTQNALVVTNAMNQYADALANGPMSHALADGLSVATASTLEQHADGRAKDPTPRASAERAVANFEFPQCPPEASKRSTTEPPQDAPTSPVVHRAPIDAPDDFGLKVELEEDLSLSTTSTNVYYEKALESLKKDFKVSNVVGEDAMDTLKTHETTKKGFSSDQIVIDVEDELVIAAILQASKSTAESAKLTGGTYHLDDSSNMKRSIAAESAKLTGETYHLDDSSKTKRSTTAESAKLTEKVYHVDDSSEMEKAITAKSSRLTEKVYHVDDSSEMEKAITAKSSRLTANTYPFDNSSEREKGIIGKGSKLTEEAYVFDEPPETTAQHSKLTAKPSSFDRFSFEDSSLRREKSNVAAVKDSETKQSKTPARLMLSLKTNLCGDSSDEDIPAPAVDAAAMMAALESTLPPRSTGNRRNSTSPRKKAKSPRKSKKKAEAAQPPSPLMEANDMKTTLRKKAEKKAEKHKSQQAQQTGVMTEAEARFLARQAIENATKSKLDLRDPPPKNFSDPTIHPLKEIVFSTDDTVSDLDQSIKQFSVKDVVAGGSVNVSLLDHSKKDTDVISHAFSDDELDRYAPLISSPRKDEVLPDDTNRQGEGPSLADSITEWSIPQIETEDTGEVAVEVTLNTCNQTPPLVQSLYQRWLGQKGVFTNGTTMKDGPTAVETNGRMKAEKRKTAGIEQDKASKNEDLLATKNVQQLLLSPDVFQNTSVGLPDTTPIASNMMKPAKPAHFFAHDTSEEQASPMNESLEHEEAKKVNTPREPLGREPIPSLDQQSQAQIVPEEPDGRTPLLSQSGEDPTVAGSEERSSTLIKIIEAQSCLGIFHADSDIDRYQALEETPTAKNRDPPGPPATEKRQHIHLDTIQEQDQNICDQLAVEQDMSLVKKIVQFGQNMMCLSPTSQKDVKSVMRALGPASQVLLERSISKAEEERNFDSSPDSISQDFSRESKHSLEVSIIEDTDEIEVESNPSFQDLSKASTANAEGNEVSDSLAQSDSSHGSTSLLSPTSRDLLESSLLEAEENKKLRALKQDAPEKDAPGRGVTEHPIERSKDSEERGNTEVENLVKDITEGLSLGSSKLASIDGNRAIAITLDSSNSSGDSSFERSLQVWSVGGAIFEPSIAIYSPDDKLYGILNADSSRSKPKRDKRPTAGSKRLTEQSQPDADRQKGTIVFDEEKCPVRPKLELIDLTGIDSSEDDDGVWLFDLSPRNDLTDGFVQSNSDLDIAMDLDSAADFDAAPTDENTPSVQSASLEDVIEYASKLLQSTQSSRGDMVETTAAEMSLVVVQGIDVSSEETREVIGLEIANAEPTETKAVVLPDKKLVESPGITAIDLDLTGTKLAEPTETKEIDRDLAGKSQNLVEPSETKAIDLDLAGKKLVKPSDTKASDLPLDLVETTEIKSDKNAVDDAEMKAIDLADTKLVEGAEMKAIDLTDTNPVDDAEMKSIDLTDTKLDEDAEMKAADLTDTKLDEDEDAEMKAVDFTGTKLITEPNLAGDLNDTATQANELSVKEDRQIEGTEETQVEVTCDTGEAQNDRQVEVTEDTGDVQEERQAGIADGKGAEKEERRVEVSDNKATEKEEELHVEVTREEAERKELDAIRNPDAKERKTSSSESVGSALAIESGVSRTGVPIMGLDMKPSTVVATEKLNMFDFFFESTEMFLCAPSMHQVAVMDNGGSVSLVADDDVELTPLELDSSATSRKESSATPVSTVPVDMVPEQQPRELTEESQINSGCSVSISSKKSSSALPHVQAADCSEGSQVIPLGTFTTGEIAVSGDKNLSSEVVRDPLCWGAIEDVSRTTPADNISQSSVDSTRSNETGLVADGKQREHHDAEATSANESTAENSERSFLDFLDENENDSNWSKKRASDEEDDPIRLDFDIPDAFTRYGTYSAKIEPSVKQEPFNRRKAPAPEDGLLGSSRPSATKGNRRKAPAPEDRLVASFTSSAAANRETDVRVAGGRDWVDTASTCGDKQEPFSEDLVDTASSQAISESSQLRALPDDRRRASLSSSPTASTPDVFPPKLMSTEVKVDDSTADIELLASFIPIVNESREHIASSREIPPDVKVDDDKALLITGSTHDYEKELIPYVHSVFSQASSDPSQYSRPPSTILYESNQGKFPQVPDASSDKKRYSGAGDGYRQDGGAGKETTKGQVVGGGTLVDYDVLDYVCTGVERFVGVIQQDNITGKATVDSSDRSLNALFHVQQYQIESEPEAYKIFSGAHEKEAGKGLPDERKDTLSSLSVADAENSGDKARDASLHSTHTPPPTRNERNGPRNLIPPALNDQSKSSSQSRSARLVPTPERQPEARTAPVSSSEDDSVASTYSASAKTPYDHNKSRAARSSPAFAPKPEVAPARILQPSETENIKQKPPRRAPTPETIPVGKSAARTSESDEASVDDGADLLGHFFGGAALGQIQTPVQVIEKQAIDKAEASEGMVVDTTGVVKTSAVTTAFSWSTLDNQISTRQEEVKVVDLSSTGDQLSHETGDSRFSTRQQKTIEVGRHSTIVESHFNEVVNTSSSLLAAEEMNANNATETANRSNETAGTAFDVDTPQHAVEQESRETRNYGIQSPASQEQVLDEVDWSSMAASEEEQDGIHSSVIHRSVGQEVDIRCSFLDVNNSVPLRGAGETDVDHVTEAMDAATQQAHPAFADALSSMADALTSMGSQSSIRSSASHGQEIKIDGDFAADCADEKAEDYKVVDISKNLRDGGEKGADIAAETMNPVSEQTDPNTQQLIVKKRSSTPSDVDVDGETNDRVSEKNDTTTLCRNEGPWIPFPCTGDCHDEDGAAQGSPDPNAKPFSLALGPTDTEYTNIDQHAIIDGSRGITEGRSDGDSRVPNKKPFSLALGSVDTQGTESDQQATTEGYQDVTKGRTVEESPALQKESIGETPNLIWVPWATTSPRNESNPVNAPVTATATQPANDDRAGSKLSEATASNDNKSLAERTEHDQGSQHGSTNVYWLPWGRRESNVSPRMESQIETNPVVPQVVIAETAKSTKQNAMSGDYVTKLDEPKLSRDNRSQVEHLEAPTACWLPWSRRQAITSREIESNSVGIAETAKAAEQTNKRNDEEAIAGTSTRVTVAATAAAVVVVATAALLSGSEAEKEIPNKSSVEDASNIKESAEAAKTAEQTNNGNDEEATTGTSTRVTVAATTAAVAVVATAALLLGSEAEKEIADKSSDEDASSEPIEQQSASSSEQPAIDMKAVNNSTDQEGKAGGSATGTVGAIAITTGAATATRSFVSSTEKEAADKSFGEGASFSKPKPTASVSKSTASSKAETISALKAKLAKSAASSKASTVQSASSLKAKSEKLRSVEDLQVLSATGVAVGAGVSAKDPNESKQSEPIQSSVVKASLPSSGSQANTQNEMSLGPSKTESTTSFRSRSSRLSSRSRNRDTSIPQEISITKGSLNSKPENVDATGAPLATAASASSRKVHLLHEIEVKDDTEDPGKVSSPTNVSSSQIDRVVEGIPAPLAMPGKISDETAEPVLTEEPKQTTSSPGNTEVVDGIASRASTPGSVKQESGFNYIARFGSRSGEEPLDAPPSRTSSVCSKQHSTVSPTSARRQQATFSRFGSASGDESLHGPPGRSYSSEPAEQNGVVSPSSEKYSEEPFDQHRGPTFIGRIDEVREEIDSQSESMSNVDETSLLLALTRSESEVDVPQNNALWGAAGLGACSVIGGNISKNGNEDKRSMLERMRENSLVSNAASKKSGQPSVGMSKMTSRADRDLAMLITLESSLSEQSADVGSSRKPFMRAPRLQTVLDRLRTRKSNGEDDSVASSNADPVDVNELFSRYDSIVKHMVVFDKSRLQSREDPTVIDVTDMSSLAPTIDASVGSATSTDGKPFKQITDLTDRGSTPSPLYISSTTSLEDNKGLNNKETRASEARRIIQHSSSDSSTTASQKARNLRQQLDHALHTSTMIRNTQQVLGYELNTFKSRIQQQRSSGSVGLTRENHSSVSISTNAHSTVRTSTLVDSSSTTTFAQARIDRAEQEREEDCVSPTLEEIASAFDKLQSGRNQQKLLNTVADDDSEAIRKIAESAGKALLDEDNDSASEEEDDDERIKRSTVPGESIDDEYQLSNLESIVSNLRDAEERKRNATAKRIEDVKRSVIDTGMDTSHSVSSADSF